MDFAEQKAKFENSRRFLFNKVPGLRLATLLKKDSDTGIFL